MPVTFESRGDAVAACLSGDIDHHNASCIREAIDQMAEGALPRTLILDFGSVGFMDSSGIGLIMGRYKLMESMGGDLKVENASAQLKKLMQLAGLSLLPIQIS